MASHRQGWLETPSGKMFFCDDGNGEGEPLVLLHGFGAAVGVWDTMVAALTAERRVLRFDLLGHGESEKRAGSYSVESQASAVLTALERLDVRRAHVVAHSAGGDVLVAMLARDASRIVSGTFLGTAPDLSFVRLGFAARLMRVPVLGRLLWASATDDALRKGLGQTFAAGFSPVPDVYVSSLRRMTYDSYSSGISELEAFKNRRDLCSRLAGGDVPLLVIFGTADRWVSPQAAVRWAEATNARVERLTGVGHTPMAEAPDRTSSLILEMLNSVNPGGR